MSSKRIASPRLIEIQAFVLSAETESMSEAAKALGLNRSTVSRYIGLLEQWLRRVLTHRDGLFELTPYGQQFLPVAKQIVELLEGARADLPH